MEKTFLFRILAVFLFTGFFIESSVGKRIKVKEEPEDLEDDTRPGPPPGFRPPPTPRPKLDPFRCDHFTDFKHTDLFLLAKADHDFLACCRSFPKGTFGCPKSAPPGHVCGLPTPPNCCTCPPILPLPPKPTRKTTTTTTEEPSQEEEEDKKEEEDEEEDDK